MVVRFASSIKASEEMSPLNEVLSDMRSLEETLSNISQFSQVINESLRADREDSDGVDEVDDIQRLADNLMLYGGGVSGDGESSDDERHEPAGSESSTNELRAVMAAMIQAGREAKRLERELAKATDLLDRYVAGEACARAALADSRRSEREMREERDSMSERLTKVEVTLRMERDENAPVKDELYRQSQDARALLLHYDSSMVELHAHLKELGDPDQSETPSASRPFAKNIQGALHNLAKKTERMLHIGRSCPTRIHEEPIPSELKSHCPLPASKSI